jgi:hypothetical protein
VHPTRGGLRSKKYRQIKKVLRSPRAGKANRWAFIPRPKKCEMESAKKAGYSCLWGGIAFIPFAFAFRWMAIETKDFPVLPTICVIFFWILIAFVVICLFYAVCGLICGYSQKSWNSYAESVDKADREGAIKACRDQGVEPPVWL